MEENGLNQLQKRLDSDVIGKSLSESQTFKKLEKFNKLLNFPVDENKLEVHPVNKNVKYLPISYMEMALDIVYFGLWETTNFQYQVIANELVGSIELRVFHPIKQIWITRTGAGAAQIMVDAIPEEEKKNMKRRDINAWALDLNNKKPAALDMGGFAAFKATCFKNACLSLGKKFGRDVNRKHEDSFRELIADAEEKIIKLRNELSKALDQCQDDELVADIVADITKAEESGNNTPSFYKKLLAKLK